MSFVHPETAPKPDLAGDNAPQSSPSDVRDRPKLFPKNNLSKTEIRTSLKASTADGIFAAVFSEVTGGVLRTNFLIDLGATPTQVGFVASIPMVANLLQPLGAHWSEKTTSRHNFCFSVYAPARIAWFILVIGILWLSRSTAVPHFEQPLITLTLAISLLSYGLGALGSAPWLSWMAAIVPRRLRGRYFGTRNSAANLTNLLAVPLLGLLVSHWSGGKVEGYGIVLGLATIAGLLSLVCQNFMTDINPQANCIAPTDAPTDAQSPIDTAEIQPLAASDHRSINALVIDPHVTDPHVTDPHAIQTQDERGTLNAVDRLHPSATAHITQNPDLAQNPAPSPPDNPRTLLMFLLFFSLWTFAFNLSAPFFNFYLLDQLGLDISQVTLYNSLTSAANLLMYVLWGKLADRIGNRPILLAVGAVVAIAPLLWLITSHNDFSLWIWLPFLHLLTGGTLAAIDLCSNNLQIGIAPLSGQSKYFGRVAAIAGIGGALGTTAGGFLAQFWHSGGLFGLFILSSILRLFALIPLLFVQENQRVVT